MSTEIAYDRKNKSKDFVSYFFQTNDIRSIRFYKNQQCWVMNVF